MKRRYLTLEDLYEFCLKNNFSHFSSKETGSTIVVHSIGSFNADTIEDSDLTPVTLQACHTELNNNRSFISSETMSRALSTFANKPILGYIHQLDDGSWDFYGHNISYIEDEESENGVRVEYDERVVGIVPESCNARIEYDKIHDKNYVVVNGYIYNLYGNRAIDIIKNNGGKTTVSVEIEVKEMSFNASEGYLEIEDMAFLGVTCLGKTPDGEEVLPGMEGANLKLDSFSAEQNSMFGMNCQEKLLETLDKLNITLSKFSIEDIVKKGVENENMNHFEELLEKYAITQEDVDFEVEGLSDEELDVIFEEHFAGCKKKKCEADEDDEDDEDDEFAGCKKKKCEADEDDKPCEHDENDSEEDFAGCKKKRRCSLDEQGNVFIEYELSHNDINAGLYTLLREESDDEYFCYWIVEVYDNKFIYQDCEENKYYRRNYTVDNDNISLNGDKVEVFSEWLSKEEKDALDSLKQNYQELKEFKESYDASELKARKDAIFAKEEFSVLAENEAFIALKNDAELFSVDEIEAKVKVIFADHVMQEGNFNFNKKEEKGSMGKVGMRIDAPAKKKAYGNLFK